jgi:hypothetical protein
MKVYVRWIEFHDGKPTPCRQDFAEHQVLQAIKLFIDLHLAPNVGKVTMVSRMD